MGSVLCYGDAVTNHIVEIDRRLSAWGFATHIYGANVDAAPVEKAQLDSKYEPFLENTDDLLIYHYSAYCDNHALFQHSQNRKVLVYHNITPAEFFRPYDAAYERLCSRGRRVLSELADCDLALGVSEYNRQELVETGFSEEMTGVLPLFLSVEDLEKAPRNEHLFEELTNACTTNILFVGKIAPNKAFEDLIKVFFHYHHYLDHNSRLILVGARFLSLYDRQLERLVDCLGLAKSVVFTDRVPLGDLKTYYEAADLFLCASRHEGFCIPLLEAMYFQLPVVARATSALPYTLGRAGIRFHRLDYPVLAETLQLLVRDRDLRDQIISAEQQRLVDFSPAQVEVTLRDHLQALGLVVPFASGENPCASTR
jgi:glycosyltransferase involved in cell wall biosynthesis